MPGKVMMIAAAVAVALPTAGAPPAFAKTKEEHVYRGRNGDYRYRCKRSHHATVAVIGAAGGALGANAIGGGTIGTIAGGIGGALLGRHIDKKEHQKRNRERGC